MRLYLTEPPAADRQDPVQLSFAEALGPAFHGLSPAEQAQQQRIQRHAQRTHFAVARDYDFFAAVPVSLLGRQRAMDAKLRADLAAKLRP